MDEQIENYADIFRERKFWGRKSRKSRWRWHIQALNGEILADSGQGYRTAGEAEEALLRTLKADSRNTHVQVLDGG